MTKFIWFLEDVWNVETNVWIPIYGQMYFRNILLLMLVSIIPTIIYVFLTDKKYKGEWFGALGWLILKILRR